MTYNVDTNEVGKEWLPEELPCPQCTSSDAYRVSEHTMRDGSVWYDARCFSCNTFDPRPIGYEPHNPRYSVSAKKLSGLGSTYNEDVAQKIPISSSPKRGTIEEAELDFYKYPIRSIPDRLLTATTCEKYGVRVSVSPTDGQTIVTHKYPYTRKGKFVGYKERIVSDKTIFSKGECSKADLFGMDVVKPGGKTLFITEGELDCLALYQTLKENSTISWEPAVISLSHGASSAQRDLTAALDFLNTFEKIVIVFDQDEAGEAATEEACRLLAGKAYIARMTEKDPCDMLLAGKAQDLKWDVLKHAQLYMPDSIVNYSDCWDRYKKGKDTKSYPWPATWKELNEKTYGLRMGELVTVTAGSGSGKSQLLREMKYHFYETTDFKQADIALEEDISESMAGMMSLRLNKRLLLPDTEVTEEEELSAFDYMYASGRWDGYDFFGGLDDDNLFSKLRFLAATGCKIIWLDHLSIIVSEFASQGNERERIDTIMTKLAKLVKELDIAIVLIVHLRKTEGKPFEEGYAPTVDDLRGSGTLKQLSWTILALSRNQQHTDKYCANTSEIIVLKCRLTGRTGVADYLHFDDKTGRMSAVSRPLGYRPKRNANKFNFSKESEY